MPETFGFGIALDRMKRQRQTVTTSGAFFDGLTLRYDKGTCCIVALEHGVEVGNWEPTQTDILRSDWHAVEPAEVPPPEPQSTNKTGKTFWEAILALRGGHQVGNPDMDEHDGRLRQETYTRIIESEHDAEATWRPTVEDIDREDWIIYGN